MDEMRIHPAGLPPSAAMRNVLAGGAIDPRYQRDWLGPNSHTRSCCPP